MFTFSQFLPAHAHSPHPDYIGDDDVDVFMPHPIEHDNHFPHLHTHRTQDWWLRDFLTFVIHLTLNSLSKLHYYEYSRSIKLNKSKDCENTPVHFYLEYN